MNTNSNTIVHPAFEILRKKRINSLDIEVSEFQHKKTGAQHIHISAKNIENVFLVALRTVPKRFCTKLLLGIGVVVAGCVPGVCWVCAGLCAGVDGIV